VLCALQWDVYATRRNEYGRLKSACGYRAVTLHDEPLLPFTLERTMTITKSAWISITALLIAAPAGLAIARVAPILIEACSLLDSATKRVECLKAADATDATSNTSGAAVGQSARRSSQTATPQYAVPSSSSGSSARSAGGQTCYTGPRGGTYTITASGNKNYSGC